MNKSPEEDTAVQRKKIETKVTRFYPCTAFPGLSGNPVANRICGKGSEKNDEWNEQNTNELPICYGYGEDIDEIH